MKIIIGIIVLFILGGCMMFSGNSGKIGTVENLSCPYAKCGFTGGSHTQIVWPHDLSKKAKKEPVGHYFDNVTTEEE